MIVDNRKETCFMNAQEIFVLSIAVAIAVFLFGLVQNKKAFLLKIFSRGVLSIFAIYVINAIFSYIKIPLNLGINYYTICTTAFMGMPGLTLLYGILGCRYL